MSWLTDLVSLLGVPAGGATLAAAVYLGSIAAEKEARKEALQDIAHALTSNQWKSEIKPSAVVKRIFNFTFTSNHNLPQCFKRSALATLIVVLSLGLQFIISTGIHPLKDYDILVVFAVIYGAVITDYFALYKTRKMIYFIEDKSFPLITGMVVDVLSSIMIFLIFQSMTYAPIEYYFGSGRNGNPLDFYGKYIPQYFQELINIFRHNGAHFPLFGIAAISTLTTSAWVVLIFVSAIAIKISYPLQRFISWFFPVEEHPIKAIGTVSSCIILFLSLIWSILKPDL